MLISVIVPIYNVEDTLDRALGSICQQSYQNLEIILVDDGSTDQSGKMAEDWSKKDSRIQVIHKENGGLSSARNAGIDLAQGDFIAFLDSDDAFTPHIFSEFMDAYQRYQMDLFIFNFQRVLSNKSKVKEKNAIPAVYDETEAALETLFAYNGLDFYAWNKIYRRELFNDIRYPVGTIYEDARVSYLTLEEADRVVCTTSVGILYFENQESIVAQDFNPKQMDNVTERQWLLEDMLAKSYSQSLIGQAAGRLFNGLLSTAYKIAKSPDRKTVQPYDQQLKMIGKQYEDLFKQSQHISPAKKFAWRLYQINPTLYKTLYYYYTR